MFIIHWLGCLLNHLDPGCTKASKAPCSIRSHKWPSSSTFICVSGHWSMFTSVRFTHVYSEWMKMSRNQFLGWNYDQERGIFSVMFSKKTNQRASCMSVYISSDFFFSLFHIHNLLVASIVRTGDCLQSCSKRDARFNSSSVLMCRCIYFYTFLYVTVSFWKTSVFNPHFELLLVHMF